MEDESQANLYRVLANRFQKLEKSQAKLRERLRVLERQHGIHNLESSESVRPNLSEVLSVAGIQNLEVSQMRLREQLHVLQQEQGGHNLSDGVASDSGCSNVAGVFSAASPYKSVLECMGHAVHVTRSVSGEIIYWNRSAEKLYGYKDWEVLGQRVPELFIEEEQYASAMKEIEKLGPGQSWSGQFPFRKRSGEIFMALVTKSLLYDDNGEIVGVITVSSDASVFNQTNKEDLSTYQDHANAQPRTRGINLKKIQWHPRPQITSVPQIASSVSNLASKILSRKEGDDTCNECTISRNREESIPDAQHVKVEKPTKTLVAKPLFGTFGLHIGKSTTDTGSSAKDESTFEFAQPCKLAAKVLSKLHIGGIGNLGKDKDVSVQENASTDISVSNEVRNEPTSHQRVFCLKCKEENSGERNSPCDAKSSYANAMIPDFNIDAKELQPYLQNLEVLEMEDMQRQADPQQFPSSGGSISSRHENPLIKGEDASIVDYGICWEDLQLREEIGKGSYATVYRGIWDGSDVAVKVYYWNQYTEEALLDQKKEIDIMRRLRHPNVLLFMGAVYSQEKIAMVTELLPRGSLFRTLHKNNQSLDIRRRLRMALDVARGMNYLHHRNPPIVHRDLKSSNLLVDRNWTVKVGDFGLSKLKNATFLTAKSGRGTPQWMAPEVLRNEPSNEKSDVFSFGVILWELMTQSIPWSNLNSLQVVGVVGFMDQRLDIPEDLDPRISSVIHDCWQSNMEHRPAFEDIIQTMTDLILTVTGVSARRSLEP